ncbi:MAG TPA: hypothetical protein V6D19_22130 [Stenomitos sp.]
MKNYRRLFLPLLLASFLLITLPAVSQVPKEIAACLNDPQRVVPKRFQEIARAKDGNKTYTYLFRIRTENEIPTSEVLITSANGKCSSAYLGAGESLTKYLPRPIAYTFAELKWKYLLSRRDGVELARSLVNPSNNSQDMLNEMGERLDDPILSPEEKAALKKFGYVVREGKSWRY